MKTGDQSEQLLAFFKALADANRLKITGLLAQDDLSVEELAALLDLRPSTISHHLARLSSVGLVSAKPESYYNVYRLETGALEAMARRLLADETLPEVAADIDMDAYDRKVLNNYLQADGRLKTIPAQRKKQQAILRHIVNAFEFGKRYSEREVNDILERFHEDTASLRRYLIENRLMAREGGGGEYWRPE